MPLDTLSLREINRATLARQMLLARERVTPIAAIERLVGLQAQWPRPPFVGLWSRVADFERSQLTTLFDSRTVVRATFVRATIHVVTAKDFLALRPIVQTVLDSAMQGILKERLDGVDIEALTRRARALLEKGPLTFEDIRDAFLRDDPDCDERAMGYAVRMRLPLVQVPVAGEKWAFPSQACFAPADQWLGKKIPSRPTPPDALIKRYLAGYGPATAADVAAWSALPRPVLREAIERLRPELLVVRDEKKHELFDLPDAPRPPADTPAPVRFVPEYDNLITARADARFVATPDRPRVFLSALRIAATLLVDGFVVGTWKLSATKKVSTVTIEPFAKISPRVRKEVVAEAEALARFAEPDVPGVAVTGL
jgi:hypothetical protein